MPRWAILCLRFDGGSVLKIITVGWLMNRLIATLRIFGSTEVPKFDIYAPKKIANGELTSNKKKEEKARAM